MSKYGPQVTIKMLECHAHELLALVEKVSKEMYKGEDWESRSTLDQRAVSLVAQTDIKECIERFGKRQQKLFKKSLFQRNKEQFKKEGKDLYDVYGKRIEELKIMEKQEKAEDRLEALKLKKELKIIK